MPNYLSEYKTAFLLALGLHGILLVFFLFSFAFSEQNYSPIPSNKTKIVEAVAVNQQQLEAEMIKIKNEKLLEQKAEKQRIERLEHQAKQAEQKRLAEVAHLHQLKQVQQQAEKEAKERLAKLKQQAKKTESLKSASPTPKEKNTTEKSLDQQLDQQLAQEQQQLMASRQKYVDSIVAKYTALIKNAIAQKWIIPPGVDKTLSCVLLINLLTDGSVVSVEINKSSGDVALDNSAVLAVQKASPLPVPDNAEVINQFKTLYLTVKPETVIEG